MNLFREVGCSCLDLPDRIRHELEAVPAPLCRVHDVQAIAQREAARLRADADAEWARLHEARASMEPPPAVCSCPDLTTSLRAALEGVSLAACDAHPSSTPAQPPAIALNDDASLAQVIGAAFGAPVTLNSSGDDLPPAA